MRQYLDALGARAIPDPTTAGDFCRRFSADDVWTLMHILTEVRVEVWRRRGAELLEQTARIDADGTFVGTNGECRQGMGLSYKGIWGYHPLLVSLANTSEPLFLINRSGNRPSHEGAAEVFDEISGGGPLVTVRKEHESAVDTNAVWGVPTFIGRERSVFVRLLDRPVL